MALLGRLGLETARIPHADRHGLIWLERGRLHAEDGTLRFQAAKSDSLDAGDHAIPFQAVSLILLGPGSSVTHDALRLLARHGTGLVAVGEGGVRLYSAPQLGPDDSLRLLAEKYRISWSGRRCDRMAPTGADLPNQAINHAATAVEGAALIAVAATATIPQLGFVDEDSASAWTSPIWCGPRCR